MKVRENMVGLFRFIILLFLLLLPVPRGSKRRIETLRDKDSAKYEGIIGPNIPLIPTEPKFCPKCHALVAQVRHAKDGTEIVQRGRVLVTVGSNVTMQGGKEVKGFPIRCPNGHTVRIE